MSIDLFEGEESGFEKQFCVLKLITGPISLPIFFIFLFLFNMRIFFFYPAYRYARYGGCIISTVFCLNSFQIMHKPLRGWKCL